MLTTAPSQDRRSPFGAADSPDTSPAADSSSLSGGPSVVRFVAVSFEDHTVTVHYEGADHVLTLDYDHKLPYPWGCEAGSEDALDAAIDSQEIARALWDAYKYGGREVG